MLVLTVPPRRVVFLCDVEGRYFGFIAHEHDDELRLDIQVGRDVHIVRQRLTGWRHLTIDELKHKEFGEMIPGAARARKDGSDESVG